MMTVSSWCLVMTQQFDSGHAKCCDIHVAWETRQSRDVSIMSPPQTYEGMVSAKESLHKELSLLHLRYEGHAYACMYVDASSHDVQPCIPTLDFLASKLCNDWTTHPQCLEDCGLHVCRHQFHALQPWLPDSTSCQHNYTIIEPTHPQCLDDCGFEKHLFALSKF